jgi:dihydrofolate reductase
MIAPEDGSIDWLEPFAGGDDFTDFAARFGVIVMGRASFDLERSLHDWSYDPWPVAVMTNRPVQDLPRGVTTFAGDPRKAMAWLTGQDRPGDIWLFGGGRTASQWLEAGLLDIIELTVVPVLLSAGRPMFAATGGNRRLKLVSSKTAKNGVQHVVYEVTAATAA